MSIDTRGLTYPLDALFRQENWRLEGLQSELAVVSRRLSRARDDRDELQGLVRAESRSMCPIPSGVIDTEAAARCLIHLRELQRRAIAAVHAVLALEEARDRLRADGLKQRTRFESIERHRGDYFRDEGLRADRQQSIEMDREWLAGANWRLSQGVSAPATAAHGSLGCRKDIE